VRGVFQTKETFRNRASYTAKLGPHKEKDSDAAYHLCQPSVLPACPLRTGTYAAVSEWLMKAITHTLTRSQFRIYIIYVFCGSAA
jgi:hypothetical protein